VVIDPDVVRDDGGSVVPLRLTRHDSRGCRRAHDRFSRCGVPGVGQRVDGVHQAGERPLCLDVASAPQREAIEPLVRAPGREDRRDGREALRVAGTAVRRIDAVSFPSQQTA